MTEFAFDVRCVLAVRVEAKSEDEARRMIGEALDAASANCGAWPDGSPILGELSASEPNHAFHLYEADGESTE